MPRRHMARFSIHKALNLLKNGAAYGVEITKITKRVGKSDYGVKGKIVKLPLLRVTADDVVGED